MAHAGDARAAGSRAASRGVRRALRRRRRAPAGRRPRAGHLPGRGLAALPGVRRPDVLPPHAGAGELRRDGGAVVARAGADRLRRPVRLAQLRDARHGRRRGGRRGGRAGPGTRRRARARPRGRGGARRGRGDRPCAVGAVRAARDRGLRRCRRVPRVRRACGVGRGGARLVRGPRADRDRRPDPHRRPGSESDAVRPPHDPDQPGDHRRGRARAGRGGGASCSAAPTGWPWRWSTACSGWSSS